MYIKRFVFLILSYGSNLIIGMGFGQLIEQRNTSLD